MRISLSITNFSWPSRSPARTGLSLLADELSAVARSADETGLHTVWVSDHLIQREPGAAAGDRDMLEAYTTLVYLAAVTGRIKLGTMVSAAMYREPALLVK